MASPFSKLGRQLGNLSDRLAAKSSSLRFGRGAGEASADGGGGRAGTGAAAGKYGALAAGPTVTSEEDEGEAALNDLAPGYFDPPDQFDALEHELRQLPVAFEASHLEAVADERTGVLEVGAAAGGGVRSCCSLRSFVRWVPVPAVQLWVCDSGLLSSASCGRPAQCCCRCLLPA